MAESFVGGGVEPPDFYIAAMGRSGSTMLCNWLTRPPEHLVFNEPFFLRANRYPRLLRIQLENFGLPVDEEEWASEGLSAAERFRRIMAPRLRGRRWAFKEVLCSQHLPVLDAFAPPRVLISVRDIADVALSLFEKHREQDSRNQFDERWVVEYCVRESAGLLELRDQLASRRIPFLVLRYEDFTRSEAVRRQAADFVGWQGGGAVDSHFDQFDRGFEIRRHGRQISDRLRERSDRALDSTELQTADAIMRLCTDYQRAFDYGSHA